MAAADFSRFFADPALRAPPRAERIELGHGSFVLSNPEPLQPYARCVGEWLERCARETSHAPAFAEHVASGADAGRWRRLAWGSLRAQVGSVAQA